MKDRPRHSMFFPGRTPEPRRISREVQESLEADELLYEQQKAAEQEEYLELETRAHQERRRR